MHAERIDVIRPAASLDRRKHLGVRVILRHRIQDITAIYNTNEYGLIIEVIYG
jgi:hypothetical protein